MTYTLTADIGDMSRAEAAALVRAILEQYGSSLVEAEVNRNAAQHFANNNDDAPVTMRMGKTMPDGTVVY